MKMPRRKATASFVLAGVLCWPATLLAATADAGGDSAGNGIAERQLRTIETEILGAEHATEHARLRLSQRRARHRRAPDRAETAQADPPISPGPPREVGAWTTPPFPIPNYAIHAAVLPTGKVIFWSSVRDDPDLEGYAALWDPRRGIGEGSFRLVPPPMIDVDGDSDLERAPIVCSGMSLLPDGLLLVTGGVLVGESAEELAGIDRVFTFDPWKEAWTEQPRMEAGRYYPSQVLLADGRTAILTGYDETLPVGQFNDRLEVFSPDGDGDGLGSIARVPGGDRRISLYPHAFTLADGNVLIAGPGRNDSARLSSQSFTWTELPPASRDRVYGTAVLRPGAPWGTWRVTQYGGVDLHDDPAGTGYVDAVASSETIDLDDTDPIWRPARSLRIPRANHNTVLLPDRSMVTTGGGYGMTPERYFWVAREEDKQVELFEPATGRWRLGPAQEENRSYHSTAVLLPDGRVFSAGDDWHPETASGLPSDTDTAEIYSPPYLFRGRRPTIKHVAPALRYDDLFGIRTGTGRERRAVLVAPGTTTHAVDSNQRLVPLRLRKRIDGKGINVVSPPSPNVAPPGYYMLFVLNEKLVPSRAAWVRLDPRAPNARSIP